MNIVVYKIVHLIGLILLFQSLGAAFYIRFYEGAAGDAKAGKLVVMMHGIGVFLLLLGGFGMIARLEIGFPFPVWTWIKLLIWVALAVAPTLVKKRPSTAKTWWSAAFVLGAIAAYMGLFKPFS